MVTIFDIVNIGYYMLPCVYHLLKVLKLTIWCYRFIYGTVTKTTTASTVHFVCIIWHY